MSPCRKLLIANKLKIKGMNAKFAKCAKMTHAKKSSFGFLGVLCVLSELCVDSIDLARALARQRFMARVQFRAESAGSQ